MNTGENEVFEDDTKAPGTVAVTVPVDEMTAVHVVKKVMLWKVIVEPEMVYVPMSPVT